MSLRRALTTGLDVRPGEERLVGLLFAHSVLLGIPRVLTSTAAMALFLARSDASNLPYVYMAAALAVPLTGVARLRLAGRLSFTRLLQVDLGLVCGTLLLLRAALSSRGAAGSVTLALPVWAEVEWVLLSLEFWGLAGSLLNVRQGKRLFGLIGAGELLAGAVAGAAVPGIVALVGTENLLLFSAAAVAGSLALVGVIARHHGLEDARAGADDRVEGRRRYGELLRSRYLTLIFGLVALSYLGYYVVDNAFYALADAHFPNPDHLAEFLGVFWAVTSLVTLLSRALLSGRLLMRWGLVGGLLALPSAVAAGVSLVALSGAMSEAAVVVFGLMAMTKLFDQALRESVDRSAVLVLYQPLPTGQRVRAQTAVEGIVGPVAGGLAGLTLLLLIKLLRFGPTHLATVLLLIVAGWMAIALLIRREYAEALRRALATRRLGGVSLALGDASSLRVLERGLRSPRPGEVAYCLGVLEEIGHPGLESDLVDLMSHPSPQVRSDVLLRIERLGFERAVGPVREKIVSEDAPAVRGAAIRALAALGEPEDIERLIRHLDDPEPEVRMGALVGLLRNGGIEGILAAGERLVEAARSADPASRAFAARTIGAVEVKSFYRPLIGLLQDPEPAVRRAAIQAAGRLGNPRLWGPVLEGLREPSLRSAALAALVAGGEGVLDLLEPAYDEAESAGERATLRRLARLSGLLRAERAARFLWRKSDTPDPELRHCLLTALVQAGFKAAPEERPAVEGRVHRELGEAVGFMSAIEDLREDDGARLVVGALGHALDGSRARVLALLSSLYPSDAILRARVNLTSRSSEKRAQAVELVDSLLSQDLSDLVIPLIDETPNRRRLERLAGRFPEVLYGGEERLRRIIEGVDSGGDWIRAAAIHAAGASGREELVPALEAALGAPAPLVREAAAWAVARLRAPAQTGEVDALVERFARQLRSRGEGGVPMLSTVEKVIILKTVSIFSETPDEILAEVATLLREVEADAGDVIFEKGDMGSALYIVVEGQVRVYAGDRTVRKLGPRDIFGEMAALDPEPRSASVAALTPTLLFRLEQEALYEVMGDRIEVVRGVIRVLCQRLRSTSPR